MSFASSQNLSPTFQNINCTGNLTVTGSITGETVSYTNIDAQNITCTGIIDTETLDSTNITCLENLIVDGTINAAILKSDVNNNLIFGTNVLLGNTTGSLNTSIGNQSMLNNTVGENNISLGYASLNANTSGSFNVAIGLASMQANTTGSSNTACGNDSNGIE
jgi:hypothetical protein